MPVSLGLGTDFEAEVATLAGVTSYDPGSLEITLLNPTGDTTIRFTIAVNIDTNALKKLIEKHISSAPAATSAA